jgi:hypothetical protein
MIECFANIDGNENANAVLNLEQSETLSSFPLASTRKRTKFPNQENSLVCLSELENPAQGYNVGTIWTTN